MNRPEVLEWKGVKTLSPRMTLTAHGPVDVVLDVLAEHLRKERYRIKDRSADRFRARYVDWFGAVSGNWNRTRLDVVAVQDGTSTVVTVDADAFAEHRHGRRHAAEGLTLGARALVARGMEVSVGPWEVPVEKRRGKRR